MAKQDLDGEQASAIAYLSDRSGRRGAAKRLLELLELEGPMSPSQAAERLGAPRPLVSMVVKDLELADAIIPADPGRKRQPRALRLTCGTVIATADHVRRRMAQRFGLRPPDTVSVRLPRQLWEAVSLAAAGKGQKPDAYAMRILLQHLAAETGLAAPLGPVIGTPVQLDIEDAIIAAKPR